jgi:predicted Zn-dependent protease with MMP-like domain
MSTPYVIPLMSAQQKIQIALGGVVYTLVVQWNTHAQCWVVDIEDQNGNPIVTGLALVTGCDLLGQYAYLNLGGSLICQTDYQTDVVPTYENLGTNSQLYFVTSP